MGRKQVSRREPKLPVQQLAILAWCAAICRFAEPVVMTSVFPYLPEMIESFGIDQSEVAKYVGLLSAVFSLAQCTTAVFWGRASDQFGRKPMILCGLIATMTTSVAFGMAQSFALAMSMRAIAGACNGNVGIIRTVVAEMVPENSLQPRAFSIMPLVWTIGSILGPSLGGFFTNPVTSMPALFGGSDFFAKYPFALPNLIGATIFLVGITVGTLFLKETLETRRYAPDYGRILGKRLVAIFKSKKTRNSRHHGMHNDNEAAPLLSPTSSSSRSSESFNESCSRPLRVAQDPPSIREVVSRQSAINLAVYTFLALHSVTFDQLLSVFMHLPRQAPDELNYAFPFKFSGGFGIGHERIGTMFTMYGIFGCFTQFLLFPPVAKRYGVLKCLKVVTLMFPLVYILTPYTALIEDPIHQQAVMFILMLFKCVAGIFAFPCSTILLTNSALSLRVLGTLNGLATSVSAIGRASGPAIGGFTFSWGVETGYIITPWWTLAALTLIGAIPVWFLVEMEGFGGTQGDADDDEEIEYPLADAEDGLIVAGDEFVPGDEAEEALDSVEGAPLSRVHSRSATYGATTYEGQPTTKRMSSPIGVRGVTVGPGGARRLSNGLGQTFTGQGAGGGTFT